jgi:mRNA interferase YafQ
MKEVVQTTQFKQDLKKLKRSGRYKIEDLLGIVELLACDMPLAERHKDHCLSGNWQAHRECHIQSDWLLIYQLVADKLVLVRTGSHSELF